MVKKLKELPFKIKGYLRIISLEADSLNYKVYLVGGIVRDIILGRNNLDLDIVIEGNAIEFVKSLSEDLGATFIKHHAFGTATLFLKDLKIDFATARKESYPHSGALPKVKTSSIEEDLSRRDFTFNAMAISLNKASWGKILDFHKGLEDLKKGVIRVFHDRSFLDDPTRILRAIRFEQRFAFRMDIHTLNLLEQAVRLNAIFWINEHRVRDELILILKEYRPYGHIKRISNLVGFQFINRRLKLDRQDFLLFKRIEKALCFYRENFTKHERLEEWIVYLAGIVSKLSRKELEIFCFRFGLRKTERRIILSVKDSKRKVLRLRDNTSKTLLFKSLIPLSPETIIFFYAFFKDGRIKARLVLFLKELIHIKLKIKGKDLKKAGFKQEKEYSRILNKLLYIKIERNLVTKRDELKELGRIKG